MKRWKRNGQMLINQPVKPPPGFTDASWSRHLDVRWIRNQGYIRARIRAQTPDVPSYTEADDFFAEPSDEEPDKSSSEDSSSSSSNSESSSENEAALPMKRQRK